MSKCGSLGVLCCSLMKEMLRSLPPSLPPLARIDDGAMKSNQISFLFVSRDPISLSLLSKAVTEGKKEWPALLPSYKRLLNDAKAREEARKGRHYICPASAGGGRDQCREKCLTIMDASARVRPPALTFCRGNGFSNLRGIITLHSPYKMG